MTKVAEISAVINQHDDFFEVLFTNHEDKKCFGIKTWKLDMSDANARRTGLDGIYHCILDILRRKPFPIDTWVYSKPKVPGDRIKCEVLGYPDGLGKREPAKAA